MNRSLLALGSNLGDSRLAVDKALDQLQHLPGTTLVARSTIHTTKPVGGPAGQADFANAAATVATSLTPLELLSELQKVEQQFGRERHEHWAARTLDLDLLLYDDLQFHAPRLTVPHPRMSFRPFVLAPAIEIAADWRHPRLEATLGELHEVITGPGTGVVIYGGKPGDRKYHATQLVDRLTDAQLLKEEPDATWLVVGEPREPLAAKLAIELLAPGVKTRPGLPTLSLPATARDEMVFDTVAAVEAIWGDLGSRGVSG